MFRFSPRVSASWLALVLVTAGLPACGSAPQAPAAPQTPPYHFQGNLTAINPANGQMFVQVGRLFQAERHVTSSTRFSGVSGFDQMLADYAAGYILSVDVTTQGSVDALDIVVQSRTAPVSWHFVELANLHTLIDLPAFALGGDSRGSIFILPWTTMRPDSELTSLDDIRRALTANELLCIEGDGFAMDAWAMEAMTIGAWHYTGDPARRPTACPVAPRGPRAALSSPRSSFVAPAWPLSGP